MSTNNLIPIKVYAASGEDAARGASVKNALILFSNPSGGGIIYKDNDGRTMKSDKLTLLSGGMR